MTSCHEPDEHCDDPQDHFEVTTLISGIFRTMDEPRFDEGWAKA
ncbi:hypothetical protein [Streptomyces sp. A0958]|nr:hypothetical protein [Streptomyces sp. A0958]